MAPLADGLPGWVFPVVASPFIGSFLGVLVTRLPQGKTLAWARSSCDHCGTRLGVRDLIPVFSFLHLRGRCRHCGGRIGVFHVGIELAATAAAIWAAATFSGPWLWPGCVLGWGLLALAWIDARTWLLPDVLTLPVLLIGMAAVAFLTPDAFLTHVTAAIMGGGALAVVGLIYRQLRGQDGLGWGDAKLLAAGGAWVGLDGLAWVVVLAAMGGLVFAGGKVLTGHRMARTTAIPFGPFLAGAIWLVFLYGPVFLS